VLFEELGKLRLGSGEVGRFEGFPKLFASGAGSGLVPAWRIPDRLQATPKLRFCPLAHPKPLDGIPDQHPRGFPYR